MYTVLGIGFIHYLRKSSIKFDIEPSFSDRKEKKRQIPMLKQTYRSHLTPQNILDPNQIKDVFAFNRPLQRPEL